MSESVSVPETEMPAGTNCEIIKHFKGCHQMSGIKADRRMPQVADPLARSESSMEGKNFIFEPLLSWIL